ncbi:hypothetical protein SPF06_07035 [Sinomonas sp. JGH33]|uniref:Tail assembly chaperone n=1 Tax=Sinomonas terricola TaxID=3110330 RepID=A0ABU5T479_9MICC|nr:hypothetical protein [Sinomonas sp. JGH33]MEA5454471.1 hypothetical protein [Sinomonas sp. JGH33]
MKFRLRDREYDLQAALERPTLLLLREMKIRTGYGMKAIRDMAPRFQKTMGAAEGLTDEQKEELFIEAMDDPDFLGVFIAMIWLARRHAGEQLSFDEAASFEFDELEMVADEQDPKEEVPEPAPVDVEAAAARPARSSTSRTSKRASSRTSS